MPAALRVLARHPSEAVAAVAYERLTHPDFTTQLPRGREHQREWIAQLAAIGEEHAAIGALLAKRKKESSALRSAMSPAGAADATARLAALRETWGGGLDGSARSKWARALDALRVELFGKWQPYPPWAWSDLSPAQRAYQDLLFDADPDRMSATQKASLARRIGRAPAGPADVDIALGAPRPFWCAVRDVAAQLRDPEPVLAAFRALPAELAAAAWDELARGVHEVDRDDPPEWKFAGDFGLRKFNVAFRQRFVELLGDMSLALGERGEERAVALAREQETVRPSIRTAGVVAAHALARHAEARGEVIDERWDPLLLRVFREVHVRAVNPRIQERLLAHLPEPRASVLRPHLRALG